MENEPLRFENLDVFINYLFSLDGPFRTDDNSVDENGVASTTITADDDVYNNMVARLPGVNVTRRNEPLFP